MICSGRFRVRVLLLALWCGAWMCVQSPVSAASTVVYVNHANNSGTEDGTSWAAALTTLQIAVDRAAALGDAEVWVAQGVYRERRANAGALALRPGMALYGGFAGFETDRAQRDWKINLTIIHGGQANGGSPAANVVAGADDAVLDGFIIRGGRGTEGAGMVNRGVSPEVVHCVFVDNESETYGGAVFNSDNASPVFTDCWFADNFAQLSGGGMACVGAGATADRCQFLRNGASQQGGAVFAGQASVVVLTGCRFQENVSGQQGGGVFLDTGADVTADFSRFLRNGAGSRGGAVFNSAQSHFLSRSSLYAANQASAQGGGIASQNCSPVLAGCTLADNIAAFRGSGLYNYDGAQPLLINSIVWNNLLESIANIDTSRLVAYHSDLQFYPAEETNFQGDPLFADPDTGNYRLLPNSPCIDAGLNASVPEFGGVNQDFEADERGFDGDSRGRVTGDNSDYDVGYDEFTGPENTGGGEENETEFWSGAGEGEGEGNPQEGEGEPGLSVIFVDKRNVSGLENGVSWNTAFSTIQAAIDDAESAGTTEIRVAAGTYDEARSGDGTLAMRDGVNLYGGFAGTETDRSQRNPAVNVSIIDGSSAHGGASPAAHVVTGANAVLDGFTITGGQGLSGGGMFNFQVSPTVANCVFSGNEASDTGGAMFNFGGAAPLVQNCRFENNHAANSGGAVLNVDAAPIFTACSFIGNGAEAGAGVMNISATPVLVDCTFTDNVAVSSGGAVSNLQADVDLRGCIFVGNQAGQFGGAVLNNQSSPVIDACRFYANTTGGVGGGVMNAGPLGAPEGRSAAPIITNCVFAENGAAQSGGAILNNDADAVIVNCTIYGNLSDQLSGGVANIASRTVLANGLFWANQGDEILDVDSTVSVTYSLVQGGYPGIGNFHAEPRLANPASRDFHLLAGSPAIDTGRDSSSAEFGRVALDFDGDARPFGPAFDIGADEFTGGTPEGEGEGLPEGEGEGQAEGEGQSEGEGEGSPGCGLGGAEITFPRDGVTLLVPENTQSAPLAFSVEVDCPADVQSVEVQADGAVIFDLMADPYTATAGDIDQLAAGAHSVDFLAFGGGFGQTMAAADARFTIERAAASDDADGNGFPANPFLTLPDDRDIWLSCVEVPSTTAKLLTQAVRWERSGQYPAVQAVLASPYDPAKRIIVNAPDSLLEPGEIGVLVVSAAPDLLTLLGSTEALQLGSLPPSDLVFGAGYLHLGIVVSADDGVTYAPIDPQRVAGMPVEVILQGVESPADSGVALYSHPATVAADPANGLTVRVSTGTWTTANALQPEVTSNRIAAHLAELGVLAPCVAPADQGRIGVSPSRLVCDPVDVGFSSKASFTVVNLGTGTLDGMASVAAPFSVVSGGSYSLARGESQQVTIRFKPSKSDPYQALVSFTGGGGANRMVLGTGLPPTKRIIVLGCAAGSGASSSWSWMDGTVMLGIALLMVLGKRPSREHPSS